ncbi:adhesion G protein-coupled receptor E4-like, partial [Plectropomus leopardus]|uniref:adhesion G protein-coupled receptor E4-like n=1 Tax=Plectropomus leopardus TaxID=160734 RepID=UPI001C4C02D2
MEPRENLSYEINSKVVTATVSNRNTTHLKEPVTLTLRHLKPNESSACVFWDSSVDGGSWSARSCKVLESNSEYTVCSCSRLGSFAVLTTLYDVEQVEFELQLMVRVGLSLSLVCLFVCIPTFSLIRSIRSPRTTIHLHLCISLFIASVVFLAGISRTESWVNISVTVRQSA